jgi:TP901 family phage tail tape measure protein
MAANRQYNLTLALTADTKQASAQLKQLQIQLSQLMKQTATSDSSLGLSKQIQDATAKVAQLKVQLQEATTSTGSLDLTKFSESLKKSNTSITEYQDALLNLGPEGTKVFSNLASAILSAEVPLKRTNALLDSFATSLKNAAKWQISSNILRGFQSSISSAYNYAQDLNESLNNIRIVTGKNSEEMANFAVQANKAAQALSTTTTTYTDASLIYYQQGLSTNEVQSRTEATIKMAQATGDSATDVSSYMTAIWNNFDDGSESLEHFGDVITALGASTASSSSEIAEGLEKFASVADTIGLSYNYATTALATVVAETRQSADVVGTAYKTIFSRFQDLELGETLDDGTTLGTYAQALATVGVQVKDASGNLIAMDDILDDLGSKWSTLSSDTQIAVAEAVAGTRQYTQLIALMDNWDKFQTNLTVAENAEGTLDEQADIYAESWEAARDRVTAAAESIYNALIDDDFFISLLNLTESALNGINDLIEGLGGLPGVLTTIGSIATKVFSKQLSEGINDTVFSVKNLFTKAKDATALRQESLSAILDYSQGKTSDTRAETAEKAAFAAQASSQQALLKNADRLSSEELKVAQILIDQQKLRGQQVISAEAELSTAEKALKAEERRVRLAAQAKQEAQAKDEVDEAQKKLKDAQAQAEEAQGKEEAAYTAFTEKNTDRTQSSEAIDKALSEWNSAIVESRQAQEAVTEAQAALDAAKKKQGELTSSTADLDSKMVELNKTTLQHHGLDSFSTQLEATKDDAEAAKKALESFKSRLQEIDKEDLYKDTEVEALFEGIEKGEVGAEEALNSLRTIIFRLEKQADDTANEITEDSNSAKSLQDTSYAAADAAFAYAESQEALNNSVKEFDKTLLGAKGEALGFGEVITGVGSSITTLFSALTSIKGLGDVWSNNDMELSEKLLTTLTTIGMVIPQVVASYQQLNGIKEKYLNTLNLENLMEKLHASNVEEGVEKQTLFTIAEKLGITTTEDMTAADIRATIAKEAKDKTIEEETEKQIFSTIAEKLGVEATDEMAAADIRAAIAKKLLTSSVSTIIGPVIVVTAAIAGLVAIGSALYKMINADTEAAEKAAEKAEALKNVASDLKSEFESLKSAFDEYDSVTETLNACTKGTEEWREALSEVNDQVKDMLDEYPELLKYVKTSADGNLYFEQSDIDNILSEYETKASAAQYASLVAAQESDVAQNKSNRTNLERENAFYDENGQYFGNIISDHLEELAGLTTEEYKSKLTELLKGFTVPIESTKDAATEMENVGKVVAASELGDEYDSAEKAIAGRAYTERVQEIEDQIKEELTNGVAIFSGNQNANVQDVWSRYKAAAGLSDEVDLASNAVRGFDEDRTLTYLENGEEKTVSKEQIATTIAAYEALEELGNSAEDAAQSLSTMESNVSDSGIAEGLRGFIANGNFENMTEEDFEKLKNEAGSTSEDYENYLEGIFGTDAEGLTSILGEGYLDKFNQALELDFSSIGNNMLSMAKDAFENLENKDQWTAAAQKSVANLMENAFESSGSKGLVALTSIFNELDSNEAQSFADAINGMSFDDISANDLATALKEAGIETDFTTEQLNNLIDALDTASTSIEKLTSSYKAQNDIISSLSTGDTISAEDYQTLDDAYKSYFVMMMDGTYQLIGAAEELQEVFQKDSNATFNARIDELKQSSSIIGDAIIAGGLKEFGSDADPFEQAKKQMSIMSALGTESQGQLAEWGQGLDSDSWKETVVEINEAYQELDYTIEDLNNVMAEQQAESWSLEMAKASQYDSLEDLIKAYKEGEISLDAFNTASYNLSQTLDTQNLDSEELAEYTDYLEETTNMTEKQAKIYAKTVMKMNNAIDTLADNFVDAGDGGDYWSSILKKSEKTSEEYTNALTNTKEAIAELLDVSTAYVSDDFITSHLDEIAKAATGDEDAIDDLKSALADTIFVNIAINNGFEEGSEEYNNFLSTYESLRQQLENDLAGMDLTVNPEVDDANFVAGLNALIEEMGMTVADVDALCDGLSLEAEYAETTVPTTSRIPVTTTYHNREYPDAGNTDNWIDREYTTTEYEDQEGYFSAFATEIGPQGTVETPKITGLTAKPTGSANNYSSLNRGGRTAGSRRGSSRSASRNSQDKKQASDEIERYHVVLNQLEDIEAQLDKISAAKDRAFGKTKLKLMDEEIAKQSQLIEKQKEYLAQIKANLKADKSAFSSYAQSYTGLAAVYDANGTITNYEALMKAALAKYNAAVAVYNTKTTDDDAAKATFEKAEDNYEKFTKLLEQYEETQDLYAEQTNDLLEKQYEYYDDLLEKTTYIVELKVDVNDDDLQLMEYYLNKIEDDAYEAAQAIALISSEAGDALGKIAAYQTGLGDILTNHGYSGGKIITNLMNGSMTGADLIKTIGKDSTFTEDEVSQIRDYLSEILSESENLDQYRKDIFEKIGDVIEENNNRLDRTITQIQHLQKVTQSYMNIVDLVGKKTLGLSSEVLAVFNQAIFKESVDNLTASKVKMDTIQQELADAEAAREQARKQGLTEDIDLWDEQIQNIEDELWDAQEEYMSAWEDALQSASDAFTTNIQNAVDEATTALGGIYGSLEQLQTQFERTQDASSVYVEDYERAYQLTKLMRDIDKSASETNNIKAKRELLELQEEIAQYQADGVEMSEYELEYLRDEYELRLAQAALDEAENAKSQVTMTRDSEGNYSYVYTANDQDVADAEQNYSDKLYEMEKLNAEYINTLQSQMMELDQDTIERIQEISGLIDDGVLSVEEGYQLIYDTRADYLEKHAALDAEMNLTLDNNIETYEDYGEEYVRLTGDRAQVDMDYVDSFNETYLGQKTGYDTVEEYARNSIEQLESLFDESIEYTERYSEQVNYANEMAGTSTDELAERMTEDMEQISEESSELSDSIQEIADESIQKFEEVIDAVGNFETEYSKVIDNILAKNEALVKSFNAVIASWSSFQAKDTSTKSSSSSSSSTSSSGSGSSSSDSASGDGQIQIGDKVTYSGTYYEESSGNGKTGTGSGTAYITGINSKSKYPYHISSKPGNVNTDSASAKNTWIGWLTKSQLSGYDTGGYTGNWGSTDGKLALLHQKELVLNKEDTDNFLAAVDVVRQISEIIDINALSASGGLSNLVAASVNTNAGTLEQQVTIKAEFPNATDKNSILEAFDNVINLAAQYANRK